MLTRSLSYYTLGKPSSRLDLADDGDSQHAPPPTHVPSLPRSISLQKLSYAGNSPATTPYKPHAHHHAHAHAPSFPLRPTRASTVEIVEDHGSAPASPCLLPDAVPLLAHELAQLREESTPSPLSPSAFVPTSTSPDGYLQTEAGSLPLALRRPLVGNALVHPVGDLLTEERRLPAALVEDFEIVGRAGDDSTCDSWIVRSKCSGKMAVFKPRDGEAFEQRKVFEEQERAKAEREERMRRLRARGHSNELATIAPASSSCPHPLSLPTSLRTPLKRGVLYGETTRKEVAAYIMDHEHFAGVPKTLEATIYLLRQDAPNGGVNTHDSGIDNYHPYLHGPQAQLALAGSETSSPELTSSQRNRQLLLQSASNSPPLSAAEPQFPFDAEELWLPAPGATGTPPATRILSPTLKAAPRPDSAARSATPPHNTHNLDPPTLFPVSGTNSPAVAAAPAAASTFTSPEFVSTTSSTPPDEFRSLGLPASAASDLIATYGSLQEFVENKGSAEDMGSAAFPADEVHRIGILDVRLLNLDRHLGNLLVTRDHQGRPHLTPIDHGFILPAYHSLQDVHLEWTFWSQCLEPFSQETLRYIARLDPIADAAKLRNLGIRDEALVSMVFSSLLLKHAAAEGLCLYHIAQMVQRDGLGEDPSTLEVIVARVLGSQQASPSPSSTEESPSPPVQPHLPRSFDFEAQADALPSVEEDGEFSPSNGSRHMSRQSSQSAAPSMSPTSPGPFSSPPVTPHQGVSAALPLSSSLLTRSNSDGAMALAEAISGRQYSAPSSASSNSDSRVEDEEPVKRPAFSTRRQSVADTAAQLIALVDDVALNSSSNSPTLAPRPAHATLPFAHVDLPTPPPPSMLRLGTELTLHDPTTSANGAGTSAGPGDMPTGAKLQHLLHVTETVIREELAAYCERHNLSPSPTNMDSATCSSPVTPAPAGLNVHGSPRAPCFNTNIRAPPKSPSPRLSPPTRSSAPFEPRTLASVRSASTPSASLLNPIHAGSINSLAASMRRSRSGSTDISAFSAARGVVSPSAAATAAARESILQQFALPVAAHEARRQLAAMATPPEAHTPSAITAES